MIRLRWHVKDGRKNKIGRICTVVANMNWNAGAMTCGARFRTGGDALRLWLCACGRRATVAARRHCWSRGGTTGYVSRSAAHRSPVRHFILATTVYVPRRERLNCALELSSVYRYISVKRDKEEEASYPTHPTARNAREIEWHRKPSKNKKKAEKPRSRIMRLSESLSVAVSRSSVESQKGNNHRDGSSAAVGFAWMVFNYGERRRPISAVPSFETPLPQTSPYFRPNKFIPSPPNVSR